jgi:predicted transcriptional regulator of viral defense system
MAKNRSYIDTLYQIAEAQLGYFTAAQAGAADLNTAVLAQLANRGVIERVSRGVYRLTRYPSTPLDSLMEAVLWPQAKSGSQAGVISHESALAFYGMSEVSPSKIHVTVPIDARIRRDIPPHLAIHHALLRSDEIRTVDAIPVTTPERSLRDAAASHLGRALLRQAIDDGLRSGVLTADHAHRLAHELLEDPRVTAYR